MNPLRCYPHSGFGQFTFRSRFLSLHDKSLLTGFPFFWTHASPMIVARQPFPRRKLLSAFALYLEAYVSSTNGDYFRLVIFTVFMAGSRTHISPQLLSLPMMSAVSTSNLWLPSGLGTTHALPRFDAPDFQAFSLPVVLHMILLQTSLINTFPSPAREGDLFLESPFFTFFFFLQWRWPVPTNVRPLSPTSSSTTLPPPFIVILISLSSWGLAVCMVLIASPLNWQIPPMRNAPAFLCS